MSRIGRRPVSIPSGVTVSQQSGQLSVKGPKGTLAQPVPAGIQVEVADGHVKFARPDDDPKTRARHGLARAAVANMIEGVTKGFLRELEIQGVGYRAEVKGKKLVMALGFSHPVEIAIPEGLAVSVQENRIKIEGSDRGRVGQFASNVREVRPPEPYKGKGIRYVGERVRRKVGKAAVG
jgi:large subunit ribosomal protein L6